MTDYYWLEIGVYGQPTGKVCSAYYGLNDKPIETSGFGNEWVLVKIVRDEQSKLEG